ncbi:MAG: hypothetical protein SO445_08350 [Lachnospiraceae bacterium]|nr:hypothetical protein [Lachnospiraceae bacterium]MDD7378642.1 hypothetical protein [Lachnospiraceae bacterium]MDY4617703.1 hypothetical protein [Lachnospiraceae bacterium]
MKKTKKILQSLDKVLLGSVTVIFLLLISLLQYIFSSTYKVPFYVLIIVMLVCYAVCIIIYAVMHSQKERERTPEYPRVITVTSRGQFVMEPSEQFKYGMLVTVYWLERDVEYEIARGYVENIQDDKKIIVRIEDYDEEQIQELEIKITPKSCKKIIIKPYIFRNATL